MITPGEDEHFDDVRQAINKTAELTVKESGKCLVLVPRETRYSDLIRNVAQDMRLKTRYDGEGDHRPSSSQKAITAKRWHKKATLDHMKEQMVHFVTGTLNIPISSYIVSVRPTYKSPRLWSMAALVWGF